MSDTRRAHWEAIYTNKTDADLSWLQSKPTLSLKMAKAAGIGPGSSVIDIGGGNSRVVDELVARGVDDVTVLDLSKAALDRARDRLGVRGDHVRWIAADITKWQPARDYDLWHDRAVFHFLTEESDRHAYTAALSRALRPGAYAIIATFAEDGPTTCSGLPVTRYSPKQLTQTLGADFETVASERQIHVTPSGTRQSFQFSLFRRV